MSMVCPMCGQKAKCKDTRMKEGFTYRRYQCLTDLHHRWSTIEVMVQAGSGNKIPAQRYQESVNNSDVSFKQLQDLKASIIAMLQNY
jgi:transcriptional regulator NrdR family protein